MEEYEDCSFDETPGYAVYGHNDATLIDATIEHCKDACNSATTFHCRSFDFHLQTNLCFLSSVGKLVLSFTLLTNLILLFFICDNLLIDKYIFSS